MMLTRFDEFYKKAIRNDMFLLLDGNRRTASSNIFVSRSKQHRLLQHFAAESQRQHDARCG